jgi:microcystin-dependent protein
VYEDVLREVLPQRPGAAHAAQAITAYAVATQAITAQQAITAEAVPAQAIAASKAKAAVSTSWLRQQGGGGRHQELTMDTDSICAFGWLIKNSHGIRMLYMRVASPD